MYLCCSSVHVHQFEAANGSHIGYFLKGKQEKKSDLGKKYELSMKNEDLRSGCGSYMRSLEKQRLTAITKELR